MSVSMVPALSQATIERSASGMSLAFSAGEQDARTQPEHSPSPSRMNSEILQKLEVHLLQVLDLQ